MEENKVVFTVNDDSKKKELIVDNNIREIPIGKGLSGTLKFLQERGSLEETVDLKKRKHDGTCENDHGQKEIRIDRRDEFGRIMNKKEAYRMICHKFHGKGPGKSKQEKRKKRFEQELKLKKMKNSDTPSLSVDRMREFQAQSKSPYIVISVARIALAKPEKAREFEDVLLRAAQVGQIVEKILDVSVLDSDDKDIVHLCRDEYYDN